MTIITKEKSKHGFSILIFLFSIKYYNHKDAAMSLSQIVNNTLIWDTLVLEVKNVSSIH